MCTVSWLHSHDGYQLFCNRDEKRLRKPARAPRIASREGVRFIAPTDGDFGGTWIFANERGIAACLLNGRGAGRGQFSRGWLLADAASAWSAVDLLTRVARRDLTSFAPFTILALEPGRPALSAVWDGARLSTEPPPMPLTSSSYDPDRVIPRRLESFARFPEPTERTLLALHEGHGPAPGPASVCMHRDDAETVSLSRIRVTSDSVSFWYRDGSPCLQRPEQALSLPRVS